MKFPMPELGKHEIDLLTRDALSRANWNARFEDADDSDSKEYEAWVNYGREAFPDIRSDFMLGCEKHHGAALPYFEQGDRWEHDGEGWTMVKKNKKIIRMRDPKPKR